MCVCVCINKSSLKSAMGKCTGTAVVASGIFTLLTVECMTYLPFHILASKWNKSPIEHMRKWPMTLKTKVTLEQEKCKN